MTVTKTARGYSAPCFPGSDFEEAILWVERGLPAGDSHVAEAWPVWVIVPGYVPVVYTTIRVRIEEEPRLREYATDWGVFMSLISAFRSIEISPDEVVDLQPLPGGWNLVRENE